MSNPDPRKGPPVKRHRTSKDKTTKRPCMCCRKEFESEGKHNRLCKYCRGIGDYGMPSRVMSK